LLSHRRDVGARLDGQASVGPGAQPALEDQYVLETLLPEVARHTGARALVRSGAVGYHRARPVEFDAAHPVALEILRGDTDGALDLDGIHLVLLLRACVEDDGLFAALQQLDHFVGTGAIAILLPAVHVVRVGTASGQE